jgi:hypothetical protein
MINTRKIAFQGVRIKKEHYKNAIHAFSHPDYTVGTGITPVHAALAARGLYRRWGISPRPEDKYAVVLALYNTPCPAKMQPLSAGFFIYCFTVTFYCISINND